MTTHSLPLLSKTLIFHRLRRLFQSRISPWTPVSAALLVTPERTHFVSRIWTCSKLGSNPRYSHASTLYRKVGQGRGSDIIFRGCAEDGVDNVGRGNERESARRLGDDFKISTGVLNLAGGQLFGEWKMRVVNLLPCSDTREDVSAIGTSSYGVTIKHRRDGSEDRWRLSKMHPFGICTSIRVCKLGNDSGGEGVGGGVVN